MRVIGPKGENFGVLAKAEALGKAMEVNLDLIEISPTAQPPVAKIMDLGKYLYQQQKKQKDAAKKSHETGVKGVQIGLGTSLHDLEMRAKKIEEFLKDGHRVRVEMALRGREKSFLKNFFQKQPRPALPELKHYFERYYDYKLRNSLLRLRPPYAQHP